MSQREDAYNKIRNAITYGELKPGDRLVEKRLCETFSVGRTALREALRQLQIEGYLEIFPNIVAIITRHIRDLPLRSGWQTREGIHRDPEASVI